MICSPAIPAGNAAAEAARALVGCRFRLHGRDPSTGLDCVGVAVIATGTVGFDLNGYAMRGGDAAHWTSMLDTAGERILHPQPGDIALAEPGPAQFHLAVLTASGFVHADAGKRRVEERPGMLPWPVIGYWRIGEA